jgi:hypothetical protein
MSATHIRVDGIVLIMSLLFGSLFVLLASSFYILNGDIEVKLMSDVRERLAADDFQFRVDFNGRDGIISGSVVNEKDKQVAMAIARSVEGVRTIKNKLTLISIPDTNNDKDVISPTLINDGKNEPVPITGLLETITPSISTSSDPDIDSYDVIVEKIDASENLTVITQKPVLEEFSIYFEQDAIELSLEHQASLALVAIKLNNDPLLLIEMSSSHLKSAVAIKRADVMKNFFEVKGLENKRFDVVWDDSGDNNRVQLKLFQNR